jgi:hypothetical protein
MQVPAVWPSRIGPTSKRLPPAPSKALGAFLPPPSPAALREADLERELGRLVLDFTACGQKGSRDSASLLATEGTVNGAPWRAGALAYPQSVTHDSRAIDARVALIR